MKTAGLLLVLATGLSGLAVVASASGGSLGGTKVKRLPGPVVALAIDRSRVAYGAVAPKTGGDAVSVWNLRTGTTTKVSSELAHKGGIDELAIAGSRVAWYMSGGGNTESDDYLFTNSVLKPKERLVAMEVRYGEDCGSIGVRCSGKWIRGVVASGNRILVNRWRTMSSGSITQAGLYSLNGTHFKLVATGAGTVEAVAADPKRVAVLHPDGTIGLYSTAGKPLTKVTPSARAERVVLSGRNLAVLEPHGKLALYDTRTGSLRKTFILHGNPDLLLGQALAVQGNIAVYSTPARFSKNTAGESIVSGSAIRALNLSTGKDRPVGSLPGHITLARMNSFGLVYSNYENGPYRLAFRPFKQVAAAVS